VELGRFSEHDPSIEQCGTNRVGVALGSSV
jgi:hypothetical protein